MSDLINSISLKPSDFTLGSLGCDRAEQGEGSPWRSDIPQHLRTVSRPSGETDEKRDQAHD